MRNPSVALGLNRKSIIKNSMVKLSHIINMFSFRKDLHPRELLFTVIHLFDLTTQLI